jgi:hypothetical protein
MSRNIKRFIDNLRGLLSKPKAEDSTQGFHADTSDHEDYRIYLEDEGLKAKRRRFNLPPFLLFYVYN